MSEDLTQPVEPANVAPVASQEAVIELDVIGVEVAMVANFDELKHLLFLIRDVVDTVLTGRDAPICHARLSELISVFMPPPPREAGVEIDVIPFLFPNIADDEMRRAAWPQCLHAMLETLLGHLQYQRVMRNTVNDAPPQPTASAAECKRLVATRFDAAEAGKKRKRGADRDSCVICLTKLRVNSQVKTLACGHVFHAKCIDSSLMKTAMTCPICRAAVELKEPLEKKKKKNEDEIAV
jgi:hypothetical protein|tara:strand:- start:67 stop:780 length:714 start_codon:yes stop_codon:yes gene_type:complete